MEENTSGMPSLEADMKEIFENIEREKKVEAQNSVGLIANSLLRGVKDLSQEFLLAKAENPNGFKSKLRFLAAEEIVRVVSGCVFVPSFEEKAKTKQEVLVYDETHWTNFLQQEFFDFVREACTRMKMETVYLHDHSFMLPLTTCVLFNLSHAMPDRHIEGEVLVNLKNGTLEVNEDGTVHFREHRREDYMLYALGYGYDSEAKCEMWQAFLDQMLDEKEAQDLLAEYVAYGLTDNLKLEKALCLFGDGSNGKSVVMEVIEALFGIECTSNVSLNDLTTDAEKRCLIENKRINISYENSKEIDPSVMKRIISGEPLDCRKLWVGTHIMRRYAKLIASFNVMPRAEVTGAFYRRLIIMPFLVTITEDKADRDLPKKLCKELPGILNWVLEGLKRLLSNKAFTISPMCEKAMMEYKLQSDSVRLFQLERLQMDYPYQAEGNMLYQEYKKYCFDSELKPVGKQTFYKRLVSIGAKRSDCQNVVNFNVFLKNG